MYCKRCRRETPYRRINRQGWWEREFLSKYLKLFPWECVQCRTARYLKDDGKRPNGPVDSRGFIPS